MESLQNGSALIGFVQSDVLSYAYGAHGFLIIKRIRPPHLEAYGLTEHDISPAYRNFGDSVNDLKSGKINAAVVVAGAPTSGNDRNSNKWGV